MEGLLFLGLWIVLCAVIVGAIVFAFFKFRKAPGPPGGGGGGSGSGAAPESSGAVNTEIAALADAIRMIRERIPEPQAFDTRPLTMPGPASFRKHDRLILAGTNLEVVKDLTMEQAAKKCHELKYCTHFEIWRSNTFVFKDARTQPVQVMMGTTRWADGLEDGVVLYAHPERMNPVAIKHVHDMLTEREKKMNEADCNGWCVGKWVIEMIGLACMFIPGGFLLTLGIEAIVMSAEFIFDHFKEENERRANDMMNNPNAQPKTNMPKDLMWLYMLHQANVAGGITGKFTVNDVMGCRQALGAREYDIAIQNIRKIDGAWTGIGDPPTKDYAYEYIIGKWEAMAYDEYNYSDLQWKYFKWNIEESKKNRSYRDGLFGMVIQEAVAAFNTPQKSSEIIKQEWFGYFEAAYLTEEPACAYKNADKTERVDADKCVRSACEPVYAILDNMAKKPFLR
jgi:hypothetical protein